MLVILCLLSLVRQKKECIPEEEARLAKYKFPLRGLKFGTYTLQIRLRSRSGDGPPTIRTVKIQASHYIRFWSRKKEVTSEILKMIRVYKFSMNLKPEIFLSTETQFLLAYLHCLPVWWGVGHLHHGGGLVDETAKNGRRTRERAGHHSRPQLRRYHKEWRISWPNTHKRTHICNHFYQSIPLLSLWHCCLGKLLQIR